MMRLTRRQTLASAAALCAASPALAQNAAPPPQRPLFGAKHWRLANGLEVAFIPFSRAPVVTQYLFYAAGGAEDPAGRSGVAHFLEHMMFKGSPKVGVGDFSRLVAREGGNDNAFTSRDVTAYHQAVEASRLGMILEMEADRMAAPLIPQEFMESERGVVLEERQQRTDSNPRARFREAFTAALWGRQHWAGRPIIGWEDEIRAISRDEVRRLVDQHYGGIPARVAARRDRAPKPSQAVEPRLIRRDPMTRDALFLKAWMAPSLTAGERAHALPLEVLSHLLGGGQGSRLHKALVETGLAVSAGTGYDGDAAGMTEFFLSAMPRPGVAPERLEEAANGVIDTLIQQGPTEAEVARAIRQLTAGAMLALDGFGAGPRMVGGTLSIGLPLDAVEFWPARISAVTRDQVEAAARAVLPSAPNTAAWLLPSA
ncbi:MAG: insulinase family protein [Acetobacteraceae bacterium]|nr:insulinase family protein [Acetobacteraceae bacterium]